MAIARSHHKNSTVNISANCDASVQGCSHMKTPPTSSPGSATSRANKLTRRSYGRRARFRGGLRAPGFGVPCGLEPILLHPPIKGAAAESQDLGRLAPIPLETLQCLADHIRFYEFNADRFATS